MALINKPEYSEIWASGGSIVEPSDVKKQTGWTAEVPPYQWENWIQNRQDQMLAHINQHGIVVWDAETEYQADKSYIQGSDGNIYVAVQTHTNQDPVLDSTDTYWKLAFLTSGQADSTYLQKSLNGSDIQNPSSFRTNLSVYSKAESDVITPAGYFYGFLLGNDVTAPNTTISVGSGQAKSSDNLVSIILNTPLRGILQSSGAWTAGDNQNKLDTGARTNSTTYHVFAIRKTSDGTGDILFSLSATAPTMPTGYLGSRWIGRVATDSSGNIIKFIDCGNGRIDLVTPSIEATITATLGGYDQLVTISGAAGKSCELILNVFTLGDGVAVNVTNPASTSLVLGVNATTYTGGLVANAGGGSANEAAAAQMSVFCDSMGRVRVRTIASTGGNADVRIVLIGRREVR